MAIDLSDFEEGAKFKGDYEQVLGDLQERLSRLLVTLHVHKRKAILVCEGWDAAGKGGAIQRLTARCDPRHYKVWPIAAPGPEEKARHYLWRFWQRMPETGEMAIFDRSWYGRVLVERVEGFASDGEWRRAYDEINELEHQLTDDGTTIVKLFFHVTEKEQEERFRKRIEHPWKCWKVTAEDVRNRAKRPDYMIALADMFANTDTRWARWTAIDGNDKKSARIAALSHVAEALTAALPADPPACSPEMEQMRQSLAKEPDQKLNPKAELK
jgi:polyphosphate kinase 2 (PPK2 family)